MPDLVVLELVVFRPLEPQIGHIMSIYCHITIKNASGKLSWGVDSCIFIENL